MISSSLSCLHLFLKDLLHLVVNISYLFNVLLLCIHCVPLFDEWQSVELFVFYMVFFSFEYITLRLHQKPMNCE